MTINSFDKTTNTASVKCTAKWGDVIASKTFAVVGIGFKDGMPTNIWAFENGPAFITCKIGIAKQYSVYYLIKCQ